MFNFNINIPFSQNTFPDIVKGKMTTVDGKNHFEEDEQGKLFFKDPVTNEVTTEWYIQGVASTTDIDRDDERMSETALQKMLDTLQKRVINVFGNHEHHWENSLAVIVESKLSLDGKSLFIKALLDDPTTNPKIPLLVNKGKKGFGLAFSIGGRALSASKEVDKKSGKKVNVIDDIEIWEVSVVGIPSNRECTASITAQIAKCLNTSQPVETTGVLKDCPLCLAKTVQFPCGECGLETLEEILMTDNAEIPVVAKAADEEKKDEKKDDAQQDQKQDDKQDEKKDAPAEEQKNEESPKEWKPADGEGKWIELSEEGMDDEEKKVFAMLSLKAKYKILRQEGSEIEPKSDADTTDAQKSVHALFTKSPIGKEFLTLKTAHETLQKKYVELEKSIDAQVDAKLEKSVSEKVDAMMKDRSSFLKAMREPLQIEATAEPMKVEKKAPSLLEKLQFA